MWAKIISNYYGKGYYDNDQMKVFVPKFITVAQYSQITGIEYVA